jgi:hypothetical protein
MALVTRGSLVRIEATNAQQVPQISGGLLFAGEALAAGAPCYILAADGLVYEGDGTAADEAANVVGFTPKDYAISAPVTLFGVGAIFEYDEAGGMTPGDQFFLAATAGRLDDTATTGGVAPIAHAIDARRIRVMGF